MLSEKEKLEEELRFLKESLEAGVISHEEYESAYQRLDSKLKEIDSGQEIINTETEEEHEENKEEEQGILDGIEEEEKRQEAEMEESAKEFREAGKDASEKEEAKMEISEDHEKLEETKESKVNLEQEKVELLIDEEDEKKEKPEHSVQEEEKEEIKTEVKAAEIKQKEEVRVEPIKEEKPSVFEEETESSKKVYVYLAAILIITLGMGYFFFIGNNNAPDNVEGNELNPISVALSNAKSCSSDEDCRIEGKIGICENSGQEDAECRFTEDTKNKLTVLNTKNCFNCETGRVLSILKNFYPNLEIQNLEYDTENGREISEKFNIESLPAFIFDSNFNQSFNYDKLSNAFIVIDGNFVMKNTVADSNYYIEREGMQGKLDLIVKENEAASLKAEKNLEEFLEAFEGKVDFGRHSSKDKIAHELGVNTFPVFLINNKIKFNGVQPADTIKENYCLLNDLDECDLELSQSLV